MVRRSSMVFCAWAVSIAAAANTYNTFALQ